PRVVEGIRPAVVFMYRIEETPAGKEARPRSGLGLIVDPQGVVVFPRRLAEGAGTLEVVLSDGRKFTPKAVSSEPKAAWAIARLGSDKPLPYVAFGDSDRVKVGDWVLSLDLPFRQEFTVELGIVSAKRRLAEKGEELIFMDSARSYPSV